MTVLIAGGAGFIGSHLCGQYLDKGFKVICLDNLITGQKKNIEHLQSNPDFKFIKADASQKSTYVLLAKTHSLDYILHFASPAGPNPDSPKSYLKYPVQTYLVNSIATHYLIELAEKNKARFIFASSSEVYGNPLKHPQSEDYFGNVNPVGPRACYDESKRFGEMVSITYGRKNKVNAKIIRIFNTYGPRMNPDDGRVIPQFILQALKNQPLTVYGRGDQTRSFCFIDDLVKGILLIQQKAKPFSIYNLGNDQEITILELARLIKNITNSSSKIVFKPLPLDDPEKRKPDLNKIKKDLHWQPVTALKQGLIKTIAYFKEKHD